MARRLPGVTGVYKYGMPVAGEGMGNPSARYLQRLLKRKGYMKWDVEERHYYGWQTQDAVALFHDEHPEFKYDHLDRDVQIGPKGWEHLKRHESISHWRKYEKGEKAGHKEPEPESVGSPVPGYGVTYPYGSKNSGYIAGYHTGHDYSAPLGTRVVAVRSGTIAWSNNNGGAYGRWLGLRADNGRDYVYCHLSVRSVRAGDRVEAGQKLGEVGSTGNSTGPHLHFEDRPRGGGYGNDRKPRW